jgi:hypothetical protein
MTSQLAISRAVPAARSADELQLAFRFPNCSGCQWWSIGPLFASLSASSSNGRFEGASGSGDGGASTKPSRIAITASPREAPSAPRRGRDEGSPSRRSARSAVAQRPAARKRTPTRNCRAAGRREPRRGRGTPAFLAERHTRHHLDGAPVHLRDVILGRKHRGHGVIGHLLAASFVRSCRFDEVTQQVLEHARDIVGLRRDEGYTLNTPDRDRIRGPCRSERADTVACERVSASGNFCGTSGNFGYRTR